MTTEREQIAAAVEAQVRHLRAVPVDVRDVPRDAMAMDLLNLAEDIRRGRYATDGLSAVARVMSGS